MYSTPVLFLEDTWSLLSRLVTLLRYAFTRSKVGAFGLGQGQKANQLTHLAWSQFIFLPERRENVGNGQVKNHHLLKSQRVRDSKESSSLKTSFWVVMVQKAQQRLKATRRKSYKVVKKFPQLFFLSLSSSQIANLSRITH